MPYATERTLLVLAPRRISPSYSVGMGLAALPEAVERSPVRPCHDEAYDGNRMASVEIAEEVEPIRIVLDRKREPEMDPLITNFIDYCASSFPRAGLRSAVPEAWLLASHWFAEPRSRTQPPVDTFERTS